VNDDELKRLRAERDELARSIKEKDARIEELEKHERARLKRVAKISEEIAWSDVVRTEARGKHNIIIKRSTDERGERFDYTIYVGTVPLANGHRRTLGGAEQAVCELLESIEAL
jgi:predicted nuclease with TOPRIM domain